MRCEPLDVRFQEQTKSTNRRLLTSIVLWSLSLIAVLAIALQIRIGLVREAGLTWDFANFYDAGHKALVGETHNLYDRFASIENRLPQGDMAFYGTPLSAYFYAPLAMLPPSTALSVFKWQCTFANLLGLLVLYWEYRRLGAVSFGSNSAFLCGFVAAAALFQPFWEIYTIGGQSTPTVFLCLVLGLAFHCREQYCLSAAMVVTAVAIKPAFLLALAILALLSRPRFTLWAAVIGALAAFCSLVWMGSGVHEAFLGQLATYIPKTWRWNSSVTVAFDNLRVFPEWKQAISTHAPTVIRCAAVAWILVTLWRQRRWVRESAERRRVDYLVAIVGNLLLLPIVWEHYLSLLFIAWAYWLAVCCWLPRGAKWMLIGVLAFSVFQNVSVVEWLNERLPMEHWQISLVAGLGKSAPLALTAILLIGYGPYLGVNRESAASRTTSEPILANGGQRLAVEAEDRRLEYKAGCIGCEAT